jgi:hypothetical protein
MRRLLVAGLLLLAGVVLPATAGAQDSPEVELRLVRQTLWLEPPGDATIVVEPSGPLPEDAVLTVTVHARLDPPMAGFERALAGELPRIILGLFRTPVAEVPRDDAGRLVVTIPIDELDGERPDPVVVLADEGLFPIRLAVRSLSGDDLARPLVLFLLRTGEDTEARPPLEAATVLPVTSGPTIEPGTTTVTVLPEERDRLARVAEILEQSPDAPLTLHVRPELMDALAQTGLPGDLALRDRFAAAADGRPVAPATFADVDPSALVAADLAAELTAALRTGEDVLAATLPGTRANRLTWLSPTGLDPPGLEALRDLGIRNLVVPPTALDGPVDDLTGIGELPAGDRTAGVQVVVADPVLVASLEPVGEPVLAAHQLLARLTATWLERTQPGGVRHGSVLVPRAEWQPDPVFMGTLLSALDDLPATEPVTLDELVAAVRAPLAGPDPTAVQLAPYAADDLGPGFPERFSGTRFRQAALGSMLPPGSLLMDDVDMVMEMSLSRGLVAADRSAYLATANELLDPLGSAIEAIPPETVTLAGRTTEIPVTVRSTVPYPVTVRLRLTSPKLVFPEGDPLVTVDGSVQLRIPVEARSNGTFALIIAAVTPEGDVPVSPPSEVTVRVTAVAGLGLALSAGAILVLATWWVHHARVARRAVRTAGSVDAATRHPAGGPPAAAGADTIAGAAPTGAEDTSEHPVVGP